MRKQRDPRKTGVFEAKNWEETKNEKVPYFNTPVLPAVPLVSELKSENRNSLVCVTDTQEEVCGSD